MRIAVRECRMDRKEFIKSFSGLRERCSRGSTRVARKKDYGARINLHKDENIQRLQRRIGDVEQTMHRAVRRPRSRKSIAA